MKKMEIDKKLAQKKEDKEASKFVKCFRNLSNATFGKMQNLARVIVLPIATLPIAGLLLGIGGGVSAAISKNNGPGWAVDIFSIMRDAGDAVFANLGIIFAVSIAFGFAKNSKGVAGLSGFIVFAVMTATIHGLFLPVNFNKLIEGKDGITHGIPMIKLGFDPYSLVGSGNEYLPGDLQNKGFFGNALGLFPTLNTSVLGGIIVGWLVSYVHNRSYNIKMPNSLAFFGGERFVPILAVFLGLGLGIVFFFTWPALLLLFNVLGKGLGQAMAVDLPNVPGQLNGSEFKPSVGGAFSAFTFGVLERLLIPAGLHHVLYTPFWFTEVGGSWNSGEKMVYGAQNIFFAQYGSKASGHMTLKVGTVFMSGRFAFMQYGYPFAALAMYMLAKKENKKVVGGILFSAALTSFLTGITEPMLFSFLFVAPLLFAFHTFMAGVSFLMAYCLNVTVGQGFAAGIIDFIVFGVVPEILGKQTGFYWIFVIGLVMAPAYFFGFWGIIKWRNYKTPGREDGKMATNIALQGMQASLEKSGKKGKSKGFNLLSGLGGSVNILDTTENDKILIVKLKDTTLISEALIRLSGTKTVKKQDDNTVEIIYLEGASPIHKELEKEIKLASEKKPTASNDLIEKIFKGLGGHDNIIILDNCATRLRVLVIEGDNVNEALLKSTGAVGVVKKGNALQVIYGPTVVNIKADMEKVWKNKK